MTDPDRPRTGRNHEPHPDDPIRCANCGYATIPLDDCAGSWIAVQRDGRTEQVFIPWRRS